jgi:hypothetical protein
LYIAEEKPKSISEKEWELPFEAANIQLSCDFVFFQPLTLIKTPMYRPVTVKDQNKRLI